MPKYRTNCASTIVCLCVCVLAGDRRLWHHSFIPRSFSISLSGRIIAAVISGEREREREREGGRERWKLNEPRMCPREGSVVVVGKCTHTHARTHTMRRIFWKEKNEEREKENAFCSTKGRSKEAEGMGLGPKREGEAWRHPNEKHARQPIHDDSRYMAWLASAHHEFNQCPHFTLPPRIHS